MKFTTKMFAGVALALSASLAFGGPIISASAVGTWNTDWTSKGSGGGVTKWRINNFDSLTGTDFEWLDREFYAMCIEPGEGRSNGFFELTDLALAPSRPSGMGEDRAKGIERVISRAGWDSFGDLIADRATRTAMSMLLWEASQEMASNPYDRSGGTYRIRGQNGAVAQGVTLDSHFLSTAPITVDGFAMVSVRQDSSGEWVSRGRQDFMMFNERNVPVPAPMALLGLGLVGMIGVRKFKTK